MRRTGAQIMGAAGRDVADLEEPSFTTDLLLRIAIIVVMVGGLIVLSSQAYGSVEDTSGPATAPATIAPRPVTTDRSEPVLSTSTVNRAALVTLSSEDLEAIEAEEAVHRAPAAVAPSTTSTSPDTDTAADPNVPSIEPVPTTAAPAAPITAGSEPEATDSEPSEPVAPTTASDPTTAPTTAPTTVAPTTAAPTTAAPDSPGPGAAAEPAE